MGGKVPPPGVYRLHGYTCIKCNDTYFACREKRNHLCLKCSREKVKEVNQQLSEKQGPYYELWLKEFNAWRNRGSST